MPLSNDEFAKLTSRLVTDKQAFLQSTPSAEEGVQGVGGVAVGAGKGFLGNARSVAQFIQGTGQRVMAAVDPTRTYEEIKQQTGFKSLDNSKPEGQAVVNMLTPKGTAEKIGSATELAAEFLVPTALTTKIASRGFEATKALLQKGTGLAKGGAETILNKVQDAVTPIEKGVESMLNPTKLIPKEVLATIPEEKIAIQSIGKSQKLEKYVKIAQKAVNDFSHPTPLEVAGQRAEQAVNVLTNKLTKQATLKKTALDAIGDETFGLLSPYRNKLRDLFKERVGLNITEDGIVSAPGRVSSISLDPADNKLVKEAFSFFKSLGARPSLKQVDDAVDAIQDALYKRRQITAIPVNTKVEGVLKQITGELNSVLKSKVGKGYTTANDKYASFVEVRDKLNKLLGPDGDRAGSLMKRVFSPSDAGTKSLFNKINELTGIDLIEDATFAKFVMENVGDARQASLLEEVIKGRLPSKSSFIQTAVEKTLGKVQDPINKARRIITTPKK